MSEDFTWQVAATSRHTTNSLRVAIVLACAGVGIIVGCLVMTAIDRASLPRVTAKGSINACTGSERGDVAKASSS